AAHRERGRGLVMPMALGVAWGVMLAVPFGGWARRQHVSVRARRLWARPRHGARLAAAVPRPVRGMLGVPVHRRRRRIDERRLVGELPVAVDLLGVAVAAGCNPFQAVELVARYGPVMVAAELAQVVRSCGAGVALDDALRDAASRRVALRPV